MIDEKVTTVRFRQLVERFGQPEQATLWVEPDKNPAFKRAVDGHRVVTLVQPNVGTTKDFGIVGFQPQPRANYLVFPRQITYPEGARVVGIKYDVMAGAGDAGKRTAVKKKTPKSARRSKGKS